jgi:recombination protein RecA
MTKDDKLKSLEKSILDIEKNFGKGSIIRLGEKKIENIPSIPSGSSSLDFILGIGGYARGRIIEIIGPESSGKTTLCLHAICEEQKAGGIVAFIDAEHALDTKYAKSLGVNINDLFVSQPDNGEQALEIAESLIDSGAVSLIIIDSVAALTPKSEIEGDMGDAQMGIMARLMSQACRKLVAKVSKSNTCVIFTNQIRMKIGVMFGSPETSPGGNALKFYASQRVDIRKIETLIEGTKENSNAYANKVRVKIIKNKMAPPFKTCELTINFGSGIDSELDLIDNAIGLKIIDKAGSWYSYKGTKIGQGKESVKAFLKENVDKKEEVYKVVKQELMRNIDKDISEVKIDLEEKVDDKPNE